MSTECIWQVTLSLFSNLFIKIAHCILSTLLYLFCLEIHRKSVGIPSEVRWTENLTSMTGFCLCPLEIQRKSSGRPTDTESWPVQPFLASKWFEWTFTGLWPDYQWNPVMSNGLWWTSDGLSAESIGNGRVWRKSDGICWTSSGSVKYCSTSAYFSMPGVVLMMDVIVGLATPSFTQFADNVKGKVQDVEQPCQALIHSKDIPSETNPRNDFNQFHSNSNNSVLSKRGPPPDDGPPGGGGGGGGGGGPGGGNTFPPWSISHNNSNASLSGGHYYPGGGGGNPGGRGGRGGPPFFGNQMGPPAPYGKIPASIKMELKVKQLPEWDGNHSTAIDYFWEVQQLAHLGGWIPEALGYWLWFHLKDKLPIKSWFITLPLIYQSYMCSHYLKFLKGIKDGYFTSVTHWQLTISHVISVCITWLIVALYLFFVLNKSWIFTVSISLKCHKISCHTTESIFLY